MSSTPLARAAGVGLAALLLARVAASSEAADDTRFRLETLPDDTGVTLVNAASGLPVWRAVCDPQQPKPYVYPLATLAGEELTANAPADHVWHHSLWFAWKYINGVNYWETDKATGMSQGATVIRSANIERRGDLSARVEMAIEYVPPGAPPVLSETRVLIFGTPRPDGSYAIDWDGRFTAGDGEIKLDRTPPNGASGGYAGLSLRFPKGTKGWSFLTSEGAESAAAGNGKPARWADFLGPTRSGAVAGIAVFDHPSNPRHPTKWYLNEGHPYFSPALLHGAPLTLAAGATMRLRYRLVVHDGRWAPTQLDEEFERFTKATADRS